MATCSSYCSTPLPEFVANECGVTIASGGKNAILFDCSADAYQNNDYTTATILADVAAGHATVMRELLVSAPDASPNPAGSSYVAGKEPKVNNYTQTIVIMDENVSVDNDAAYEAIDATEGREIASVIVTTADGHSELFESITSFQATVTKPIADNVDDSIHYSATLTGKMKHKSKMIATPANVY